MGFSSPSHLDEPSAYQLFVGIDWGSQMHHVCVLDSTRRCIGEREVKHDGFSLSQFATWLSDLSAGEPSRVAVAIEMPRGAMVEMLVERGFQVFAINPKPLARFRERHTVAGAKDDRRDAWVLADSLRTDLPSFRPVRLPAPELLVLRELSRTEEILLQEFRRMANRLREQLHRYYPQMLRLCAAADEAWMWDLFDLAPTPAHAQLLSEEQVHQVLKTHRIRRLKAHEVLTILQAPALPVAPGTAESAQAHCTLLLPCLRVSAEQLRSCAQQVNALLSTLAQSTSESDPSTVAIVPSLPGVGRQITTWLMAEADVMLDECDYQTLRTQSGLAPVTRQSGKRRQVVMRRACNKRLRHAFYHLARLAVQSDAEFASVYEALRAKGQRHGQALRNIAGRILQILMAMLRDRTLYNPSQRQFRESVQMSR